MTKPIDALLEKEMSRKEAVMTLAFGAMTIFGFSTIINLFTGRRNPLIGSEQSSRGYGSSGYGR